MANLCKVIALAFVASMLHLATATAAPNTTPDNSQGKVRCSCKCRAGGLSGGKIWDWTGSRDGCQSYNGGRCLLVMKNSQTTHEGTLESCDVIVIKTRPKYPPAKKPTGGVLAPR